MAYSLLSKISNPQDLKQLSSWQMPALCKEIREFLIEKVSSTGGHLSSNLGTIELTVALHRAYSSPKDSFVFDVGHQCYTHKLLTGRQAGFDKLRKADGLSGFPSPQESEHDCFIAGHGNTALSAAIGMAQAKRLRGDTGKVIAIIGDGAFTGGMVYEGMNNIDCLGNLVVILNDNKMSISKNVGSVANYFTKLRTDPQYSKAKAEVESALHKIPVVGNAMVSGIQNGKKLLRRAIYNSTMFENMGFQYVGPVDGHDVLALEDLFVNLQKQTAPLFVHIVTQKGKGFEPAEQNPGAFHGVSAFDVNSVPDPDVAPEGSFSTVFGEKLTELAGENKSICAITAAMKYGTGLQFFYKTYPQRFFDVGMAEQHAVTFAAGLAQQKLLPVVSIYSTFLQRSYDQMIHDVNLQNLNVLFAVDRAGLVPADGETHQGIYDPAYFSQMQTMTVISPSNFAELEYWLEYLVKNQTNPRAIRYPRGKESAVLAEFGCSRQRFDKLKDTNAKIALVSYGSQTEDVLQAHRILKEKSIETDVLKLVQIHPLPKGFVQQLMKYDVILFAEECVKNGGIGEHTAMELYTAGWRGQWISAAVPNLGVPHATVAEIKTALGLNGESLAKSVMDKVGENV